MSFTKKIKNFLIIDDGYLKIIQLEKNHLLYCKEFNCNLEEINLNDYLNKVPHKIKRVTLLVPGHRLFFDSFRLPENARERIEDIINVNFISKLAVEKDELYYSYYLDNQFIGDDREEDIKKVNLLTFAVKQNYIDDIYKMCQEAGIQVDHIFPLPLYFFLYHNPKGKHHITEKEAPIFIDYFDRIHNFTIINSNRIYMKGSKGDNKVLKEEIEKLVQYADDILDSKKPLLILNNEIIEQDEEIKEKTVGEEVTIEESNKCDKYEKGFWSEIARRKLPENLDFKEKMSVIQQIKKKEKFWFP